MNSTEQSFQQDSPYSWTRLMISLLLSTVGGVGIWSTVFVAVEVGALAYHYQSDDPTQACNHCRHLSAQHTKFARAFVTAALDLDDAQEAALDPVVQVLEGWRVDTLAICESVADHEHPHEMNPETMDAHLSALQSMLAQTSDRIGELRPALADFHATLDEDQIAQIKEAAASHRRFKGFGHGRGRHGGRWGH